MGSTAMRPEATCAVSAHLPDGCTATCEVPAAGPCPAVEMSLMRSSDPDCGFTANAITCPGESPCEANRNFRSGLAARYDVRPPMAIRLRSVSAPVVASNV